MLIVLLLLIIYCKLSSIYITENFDNAIMETINNNYYQIVSPESLNKMSFRNYNDISNLFEIDYIVNKQDKQNCLSYSLFCDNVNNTYTDEFTSPSIDVGSEWYNKYYKSFINLIDNFNNSEYTKIWKLRIFLEPKLISFLSSLKKPNVEIYVMKNNSIGAQPGMLWRYLSFDDTTIDRLFCGDIDEDFVDVRKHIDVVYNCYDKFKDKVFIRTGPYYKNAYSQYKIKGSEDAINVTTVLGSRVGFYPKRSSINLKDLSIKYICLRIDRYNSKYPHLDYDSNTKETVFNKPLDNKLGWGGHWFKYGFDEKFLKAVVFPYFTKRGETINIINEKDENVNIKKLEDSLMNSFYKTELMFSESYNNAFYFPE